MKLVFAIALCTAASGPALALDTAPISPTQASGRQGDNVVVEGRASVRPASPDQEGGRRIALGSGDNSAVVVAYVSRGDMRKFPHLKTLNGRLVDVQGIVEMASGQAEIHLTSPTQLSIVR